jgi:hypothetical protein
MQLNGCCNASLPNPSCLAGERRLAVDDDLALLRHACTLSTKVAASVTEQMKAQVTT